MTILTICPVPKEQRPLEEYKALTQSWFFSYASKGKIKLTRTLISSWIATIPLALLISTGSIDLRMNISKLIFISFFSSILMPIIILLRQLLGWSYIFKRLVSEKVEYEETGWYDGQTWEKPLEWKEKEYLIAHHEVKPVLNLVKESIVMTTLTLILLTIFYCFFY